MNKNYINGVMYRYVLIFLFLFFSCKEKPKNLINRLSGDANFIVYSNEFKDSTAIEVYKKGIENLKKEKIDEAKKLFLFSLKIEPNNTTILNTIGGIEADLNNFTKSFEYFEKSLKTNKNNSITYLNYGVALNKANEQNKAIKVYNEGLKIEMNYERTGYFYYNIANVLYKQKKYLEAKKYLKKASEIVVDKEAIKDIVELEAYIKNDE